MKISLISWNNEYWKSINECKTDHLMIILQLQIGVQTTKFIIPDLDNRGVTNRKDDVVIRETSSRFKICFLSIFTTFRSKTSFSWLFWLRTLISPLMLELTNNSFLGSTLRHEISSEWDLKLETNLESRESSILCSPLLLVTRQCLFWFISLKFVICSEELCNTPQSSLSVWPFLRFTYLI